MICAIENQRRAFQDRETQIKKSEALQTAEFEEN